jgi:transposase
MSLDNPYGINPGWKVDPDGRYDRSPGPVTTRQMTEEEREKYNQVKGQYVGAVISGPTSEKVKQIRDREMEEKFMATMTKEIVKKMALEGMDINQIAEQFEKSYPRMKLGMIKAKITMLLSDKKSGLGAKKDKEEKRLIEESRQAASTVKESAENAKQFLENRGIDIEAVKKSLDMLTSDITTHVETSDNINQPPHYLTGGIEVTDYIQAKLMPEGFEGFCIGTALRYISRYRLKGGLSDLKKAQWYLNRIIRVKEEIGQ